MIKPKCSNLMKISQNIQNKFLGCLINNLSTNSYYLGQEIESLDVISYIKVDIVLDGH